MMSGTIRSLAALAAALLAAGVARGESWAERVAAGNREVVTAEDLGKLALSEPVNRRGKVVLRRIKPADPRPDWNSDPTALPYVTYQFEQRTGLPTYTNNEGIDAASDEVLEYPLLYLTAHSGWSFTEAESDKLTKFLARGGSILLDDCYIRRSSFTDSVLPESSKICPGAELRAALPDDPHVGDLFRLCYCFEPSQWPGGNPRYWNNWQYILCDGRPAIVFTPNDDGCAWEVSSPPTASNPIGEGVGHGGSNEWRELCYQWITDWFLFALTH